MGGKRHNWHRAWTIDGRRLIHISGAAFVVTEQPDGALDIDAAPETLGEYQSHELARGVPVHDLTQRLHRLAREAGELWQRQQQ